GMKTRKQLWAVSIMLLMTLALVGCMETAKYNEFVDKANKAVAEQIKQDADIGKKSVPFAENLKDLQENRDALKSQADEIIGLMDKSITNIKSAAENWEAASKLNVDDKLKEYATVQAQYCRKSIEANEYSKKMIQLVNDPSVTDYSEYQ